MARFPTPTPNTTNNNRKARPNRHPCPYHCRDSIGRLRYFAGPHNVAQHIREKHTHERPYRCMLCGPTHKGFARPGSLNRHMGSVHGLSWRGDDGSRRVNQRRRSWTDGSAVSTPLSGAENGVDGGGAVQDRSASFAAGWKAAPVGVDGLEGSSAGGGVTRCHECNAVLESGEACLEHLHAMHGMPMTPYCGCAVCGSMFGYGASDSREQQQLTSDSPSTFQTEEDALHGFLPQDSFSDAIDPRLLQDEMQGIESMQGNAKFRGESMAAGAQSSPHSSGEGEPDSLDRLFQSYEASQESESPFSLGDEAGFEDLEDLFPGGLKDMDMGVAFPDLSGLVDMEQQIDVPSSGIPSAWEEEGDIMYWQ
ncbi:hypothetical protein B0A50_03793 [Salinomyces thailandicus]|uniref:C2H2-type domain-containing protein n=1 Tax=Salinomyces thailandicus TaxID=706561 RepID=A0A4U0U2R6_9PEZI|nr:hypothetical protein B0A50_03793 [Salinomyces thailandica]